MQRAKQTYPIDGTIPRLMEGFLQTYKIVLSAPPGAGKTTRVPIALLDSIWMSQKKLIMLEPRRLAARCAAEYMAAQLGESVGQTVGYRIRGESVVSSQTRIEIVTEGVLTRLLQHEPDLPNVALIIFDEFHERSIHADLGLALILDIQEHLRPDLRVLVMSATLDNTAVIQLMGDARIVESKGRNFPVTTFYMHFASDKPMEIRAADAIHRAIEEQEGDVLVFLPGGREIRRVENLLWERKLHENATIHSLFGDAPYKQQLAALSPSPDGKKKVILSTSIAETSLTIDGVRVVIDSGLARTARFDVRRGMSGLVTVPVSKAVANQRQGRAGRQYAGVCYRLWTEKEHESLPDYPQPEIKITDLAPLALDFALWGTPNGENLQFIDTPPLAHLARAQSLLKDLGAVDNSGRLTKHGREMAEFPLHPRLSHMILRGKELGHGLLACDIAALLDERDILAGKKDTDIDLASRLHILHDNRIDREGIINRIIAQSKKLGKLIGVHHELKKKNDYTPGILLALAYPERIARKREKKVCRYQMVSGTTAILPIGSTLTHEEFLSIGEVDGIGAEVRVFLAAPLLKDDLEKLFTDLIIEEEDIRWSPNDEMVISRHISRLGAVIISEKHIEPRGDKVIAAMIEGIRLKGIEYFSWDNDSRALQQRFEWLRKNFNRADWPDLSDSVLLETLEVWLAPYIDKIWRGDQLQKLTMTDILYSKLTFRQREELEKLAPSHIRLPSGSRIAIDYSGNQPVIAVKLQELFGQVETPKILGGKIDVLVHLLSPARRPLAVTQDLRSFWTNVYPEIRTQMRARYPKHIWPDDPLTAKPTNKTKRR